MLATNTYIIKTLHDGVKVVAINTSDSLQLSVEHLFNVEEWFLKYSDSLQLHFSCSHITIATTQNELVDSERKSSIKLMKM